MVMVGKTVEGAASCVWVSDGVALNVQQYIEVFCSGR